MDLRWTFLSTWVIHVLLRARTRLLRLFEILSEQYCSDRFFKIPYRGSFATTATVARRGRRAPVPCNHVDMPTALPLALTRQTLRTQADRAEMLLIESKAKAAAMSVNNYVRSLPGPSGKLRRPTDHSQYIRL